MPLPLMGVGAYRGRKILEKIFKRASQPKEPYIWQHWIVYSTFDTKIVTNINILPDSFHPHIIIQHLYAQAIIYIS